MDTKQLPLRKCVACNGMFEKYKLFRLVRLSDGIHLDLTYKMQGRGAYVCKNKSCIDLALKKKGFNRSLRQAVPTEVFDNLYMELENDR
ncbi:MAG: YlxR family protein [Pseudobutyrivibrio ruminis]|uniref:YlxR family protein n=1 Tax=Pseudobutyrivibrio ruminis TaxID=46206 RepID=A0A927UBF2_9FIRM|nr:YlxR family protein [Pseudobutyrivibrio ruminis]